MENNLLVVDFDCEFFGSFVKKSYIYIKGWNFNFFVSIEICWYLDIYIIVLYIWGIILILW